MQSRIANDIGGMQATVTTTATALVSNFTTVIATVIAMIVLEWRLAIASLVMMPIFIWVNRRVGTDRRVITREWKSGDTHRPASCPRSRDASAISGRT